MMPGVAMHKHPLGNAEINGVTQPEAQTLRVEIDRLGRVVAEQERMSDTQVARDELYTSGRNEWGVVDLVPVVRLELMAVTVGERDEAANLTVAGQLVIGSHVDSLGRE